MKWDYVATGLALISIGIALLLAPLPPPWWPNMSKGLTQAVFAVGLLIFVIGAAAVATGVSPVLKDRSLWPQTGMVIFGAAFIVCAIWYFFEPQISTKVADEKLPGIAVAAVLNIQDVAALRRKYVFEYTTPEHASTAFYLSASDIFTFTVTDIHGEAYPLEVPLGKNGIPFGQFMHLVCEAGSGSNYSFLSVSVNGKEIKRRDLPARIDLGSRQWNFTLGADQNGNNNGAFLLGEMGASPVTFTNEQVEKLAQNARNFYKF
jgi:hypothetical protein